MSVSCVYGIRKCDDVLVLRHIMNADEIRPLFPSAKAKKKNVFDREEERKKSEGGQVLANQITCNRMHTTRNKTLALLATP